MRLDERRAAVTADAVLWEAKELEQQLACRLLL